ncbi:MAG: hypothetical protein KDB48_09845, partial [Solirubrobacterales bacterium]|nr:hypothetical protein [Solirubrobacterales bacterium]
REMLEEELRRPGVYYSVLEELAQGKRAVGDLAQAIGTRTSNLQGYLETLVGMRLVRYLIPVTERKGSRRGQFELADEFMKFWFRFVFPYQEELKSGLKPADLYRLEIAPHLNDHIAPVWERLCRQWSLGQGSASRVGGWWGPSLNTYRRSGERQTEEIDLVGLAGSTVKVLGECKWTATKMPHRVLTDLEAFKLPALVQSGAKLPSGGPLIQLFSRSGFTQQLIATAAGRPDIELIGPGQILAPGSKCPPADR